MSTRREASKITEKKERMSLMRRTLKDSRHRDTASLKMKMMKRENSTTMRRLNLTMKTMRTISMKMSTGMKMMKRSPLPREPRSELIRI